MRRKLISIIASTAIAASFLPVFTASAEGNIKLGDYLQMGTYYGQPILWRCVDEDEHGSLMLSDRILCLKPYDTGGYTQINSDGGQSSHARVYRTRQSDGSNYWKDSNIRSWLNSDAEAGKVEWFCGNPSNTYRDEAGFLTNFKQYEKVAIKEVAQKSILGQHDYELKTIGSEFLQYHYYLKNNVAENYDKAYGEMITDKMFLLDVKQVQSLYDKTYLSDKYYRSKPTSECVAHSKSTSISEGSSWDYWLRTPYYQSGNSDKFNNQVRYVRHGGGDEIDTASPYANDKGVRPAFYLAESAQFGTGEGTADNPYTIKEVPMPKAEAEHVGDNFTSETETDNEASVWKLTVTPGEGNSYSSIAAKVTDTDKQEKQSNPLDTAISGAGSVVFALVIGRKVENVQSIDAILGGTETVKAYTKAIE